MKEGWQGEDYLILFEGPEIIQKEEEYAIRQLLPGYRLLGLIGWDEFLVLQIETEQLYCVPTIPAIPEEMKEWNIHVNLEKLHRDETIEGKIKWYVKPIIFGGDPNPGENLVWIEHHQHPELVRYWNQLYQEVSQRK